MARMITIDKLSNITPWGSRLGGQLVYVTSSTPRKHSPRSGYPKRA